MSAAFLPQDTRIIGSRCARSLMLRAVMDGSTSGDIITLTAGSGRPFMRSASVTSSTSAPPAESPSSAMRSGA